jgi:hypothetical protein
MKKRINYIGDIPVDKASRVAAYRRLICRFPNIGQNGRLQYEIRRWNKHRPKELPFCKDRASKDKSSTEEAEERSDEVYILLLAKNN